MHQSFATSDQSIASAAEDKLGTRKFASELARCLITWPGDDSIVVGVYGSWGQGKTSIKNMCLEVVQQSELRVLEFNPWLFASAYTLHQTFFRELSKKLDESNEGPAAMTVRDWQNAIKVAQPILKLVDGLVPGLGAVAVTVAESASRSDQSADREELLEETRKKTIEALHQMKAPILVVIDDIDRLSPSEILLIFQLVKSQGNLPNIRYLLLFDSNIVVKALDSKLGGSGAAFLEKIVQIALRIPHLESVLILKFFNDHLFEILKAHKLDGVFDKGRWNGIVQEALLPYLDSLRSANRFLNSAAFYLGLFSGSQIVEVDVVDFLLLEVLRVFEPATYESLYELKKILCSTYFDVSTSEDLMDSNGIDDGTISQMVSHEDRLASLAKNLTSQQAVIRALFPGYAYVSRRANKRADWDPDPVPFSDEEIVTGARISDIGSFGKYFHFRVQSDDVSRAEIKELLDCSSIQQAVCILKNFKERGVQDVALGKLRGYAPTLEEDAVKLLVAALFQVEADGCASDRRYLSNTVHFLLKHILPAVAAECLRSAVAAANSSLYIPVQLAATDASLFGANWESVKKIAVEQLRRGASEGFLCSDEFFLLLVVQWSRLDQASCMEWLSCWLGTSVNATHLAKHLVKRQVFDPFDINFTTDVTSIIELIGDPEKFFSLVDANDFSSLELEGYSKLVNFVRKKGGKN